MRMVIQHARDAKVEVDGKVVGAIDRGIIVYFGVAKGDTEEQMRWLCDKMLKERIFRDGNGKTNLSVQDIGGQVLLVSQFTLYADLRKGNRPGYDQCESPDKARAMYEAAVAYVRSKGVVVQTGVFGAHMVVSYTNDGPGTFLLEK